MAVAVSLGSVGRAMVAGADLRREARTYVVRSGDTLWSIASRRAGGLDPRLLVQAIERENEIGPGDLVPGQSLILPRSV